MVLYRVNEGKPMNAGDSITSKDEKPANMLLKNQLNNIDWKKAQEHVNRLQVRITKAVKHRFSSAVYIPQKNYLFRIRTYMQAKFFHGISL